MNKYPIRQSFRAWDFVLTQDAINGGLGLIPLSAILKNPDNEWVVRGEDGVGIPQGGDAGQVLRKVSGADYATEWATVSGAGAPSWDDVTGKPTTFPPVAHSHPISDVTGLQSALDGKQAAGSYAASIHGHAIADVTGLQTALDGKQTAGSYAAASHTHVIADVTGLQTALDGKQAAGSYQPLAAVLTNTTASFTTALETKLNGIASGATANAADSALRDRSTHTGTQTASTISDFNNTARAQVEGALIAGSNITITPAGSGASRTLTIASTGGSGGLTYQQAVSIASLRV